MLPKINFDGMDVNTRNALIQIVNYLNDNPIRSSNAFNIFTNTTQFNNLLTSSETDVQKALQKIVDSISTDGSMTENSDSNIPTEKAVVTFVGSKYIAKAWVNFNGTGVVAIKGSGNVSSITDNAVGFWTANFTVNFADTNFAIAGACGTNGRDCIFSCPATAVTVSAVKMRADGTNAPDTPVDADNVSLIIFR